jgi:hypothetical protein
MTDKNKIKHDPDELPDFFKGMVCAYEDCADFIEHLCDTLPEELAFFKPVLKTTSNGIREKVQILKKTVAEEISVTNLMNIPKKDGEPLQ